jgi:membrane associated rhomboid family serine protease
MRNEPRFLLSLGLVLMLLGIILPFLMVMRVIESTFLLNFVSWSASVAGLFLGFIGVATWSKMKKDR